MYVAGLSSNLPLSHVSDTQQDSVQNDDHVGVLLMDQSGAVGLDLSFVSHVFLLEPLEDLSLHKQVISRAHRMGAKVPINVEILVMKVTLEFLETLVSSPQLDLVPCGCKRGFPSPVSLACEGAVSLKIRMLLLAR